MKVMTKGYAIDRGWEGRENPFEVMTISQEWKKESVM
jgi:hypothetical protein